MTRIKGRIAETIYPNGTGAITAEKHQSLLLDMVDNINEEKQDVLVSGQNIRPLVSGESLLGSNALGVLGTRFVYELESQQLFAMIDGALSDFNIWMANKAVNSQVAQVIEIRKEGYFQELVPLTLKNKAGLAALSWEYDGMIYETSMEDGVLTVISKPKGEEFDKQGYYPSMQVGKADDLSGHGESVPAEFTFRATGGKSIKDGTAYIKELQGNAVVWNQLLDNHKLGVGLADKTETDTEVRIIPTDANGNKFGNSVNVIEGHYYLQMVDILSEEGTSVGFANYLNLNCYEKTTSTSYVTLWQIAKATSSGEAIIQLWSLNGTPYRIRKGSFVLRDLTKMFNAGNEPTSLEEYYARKPIVADEYAFNEGEVIAFKGDAIKSVGDNALKIDGRTERVVDEGWEPHIPKQFDENVWYNGVSANGYGYGWTKGNFSVRDGRVVGVADRTSYGVGLAVRLLPNEEYYISAKNTQGDVIIGVYDKEGVWLHGTQYVLGEKFTTPSNAAWGLVVVRSLDESNLNVDVSDIMLTLVHSGWKVDTNAGYQPYWADTLQIDSRIRAAFPNGMMPWDKVYNKDGKGYIVKGTGVVEDMGALDWGEGFGGFITTVLRNLMRMPHTYEEDTILCSAMTTNGGGKSIGVVYAGEDYPYNGTLKVLGYESRDDFLADIQGIPLYYELAEPTIEPFDTPFKLDYKVADFGTEELISAEPSAPFKARTIYQFNAVDQIRENAEEIKKLKEMLNAMSAQLAIMNIKEG